jgi:hypothetical protein
MDRLSDVDFALAVARMEAALAFEQTRGLDTSGMEVHASSLAKLLFSANPCVPVDWALDVLGPGKYEREWMREWEKVRAAYHELLAMAAEKKGRAGR